MKIGFNEATALECKGQSLMADIEMCEKYGFIQKFPLFISRLK